MTNENYCYSRLFCASSSRCKSKRVPEVEILTFSLQSSYHVVLLRSLIANLIQLLHNNLPQGTLFGSYSRETSHHQTTPPWNHSETLDGAAQQGSARKEFCHGDWGENIWMPHRPFSKLCICVRGNDEHRWRWQRRWRLSAVRPSWMSWPILTHRVSMAQWGNGKHTRPKSDDPIRLRNWN